MLMLKGTFKFPFCTSSIVLHNPYRHAKASDIKFLPDYPGVVDVQVSSISSPHCNRSNRSSHPPSRLSQHQLNPQPSIRISWKDTFQRVMKRTQQTSTFPPSSLTHLSRSEAHNQKEDSIRNEKLATLEKKKEMGEQKTSEDQDNSNIILEIPCSNYDLNRSQQHHFSEEKEKEKHTFSEQIAPQNSTLQQSSSDIIMADLERDRSEMDVDESLWSGDPKETIISEMQSNLSSLSWRRIDVWLEGMLTHTHIVVKRKLINSSGKPVIMHLIENLVL
eukprot:TRINITY_DN6431_c0_g1_i2.p2 TRINITY_DN6431_c0_g1~~TRINITY_DN6431_c0_g1_i2.p2  ORF type:complete len:276 (+),score=51.33 TRINITY_DN6431_c0_g1_i2:924-1751(+)